MSRRVIIAACVGGAAAVLLRLFVFALYTVPSPSMAPTIVAGDWLAVNRLASQIERGDVIVFELHDQVYVKRVLGVPGDQVTESSGRISINGTPIASEPIATENLDDDGAERPAGMELPSYRVARERWADHSWTVAWYRGAQAKTSSWTVPAGSYMVIGDNRNNSLDSRTASFGFVPQATVKGKLVCVLGNFRHRGRWFLRR